jgi:16S rRNA (guanine966-N2)-methyltransferase
MGKRRGADRKSSTPGRSARGRLRIVAGKWRSRLLPIADAPGLRPTPERIRETLFNWLAPHIRGAHCLDLFAGSGALGFEALSRGAKTVDFVERSATAAAILGENATTLDATGARVLKQDAFDFLQSDAVLAYDIVFLDPPFDDDRAGELCRLLQAGGFVRAGTLVYLEQPGDRHAPEFPGSWSVRKEKAAGNVRYSLIEVA